MAFAQKKSSLNPFAPEFHPSGHYSPKPSPGPSPSPSPNDDGAISRSRSRRRSSGGSISRKCEKQLFMAVIPNGSCTTAMIRNIPNQYTRDMLIKFLDEFCRVENQRVAPNDARQPLAAYDFLYLPMDFKRDANKGYAFVNFTRPIALWKLHLACSNQRWDHCKSPKICFINYASIQGKEKLVEHFGKSRFLCKYKEYLPACFNPPRDGSGVSVSITSIGELINIHPTRS